MRWRIFTNAGTEAKAKKVSAEVLNKLREGDVVATIEPYQKGGFVCSFATHPKSVIWSDVVFESIALAQLVGRGWILSGDILTELDVWSNDAAVAGVQSIHLSGQANT